MFGKTFSRALALSTALALAMTGVVSADNAVADGDGVTPVTNQDMAFGNVSCNVATAKTALIAISRKGGQGNASSTNTFANSAVVTVSVASVSGTGLSATIDPAANTITLPSNWTSQVNGTMSAAVSASVSLTSTTEGAGAGSITFRATGSNTSGATITRDDPMAVSWTTGSCTPTPPANTTPSVAFTAGPTSVSESSTAEHTFSFSITDGDAGDSWTFVTGYPTCGAAGALVAASASIGSAAKTGTFKCIFDDGLDPAVASTVAVKVKDAANAASAEATRAVTVSNVVPTISSFTGSPVNTLTGLNVTYTASADDMSAADRTTGFTYSFNGGTFGTVGANTLVTSYSTCGLKTESVRAQDKDNGISLSANASVNVYDGGFHGAIVPAQRNLVQKGRVIPVQIRLGCGGIPLTGLTPSIVLLSDDVDPATDDSSATVLVPTTVSSADTTGVMRATDEGYIYNLHIPSNATAGDRFTIRVRPWGSAGPTLQAIVEIRK